MKPKPLLGDEFDPSTLIDPPMIYEELRYNYNKVCSLLDSAYEIVELLEAKTPSQIEWKRLAFGKLWCGT